ncbi:hypothetical protein C8Q78DRAFT_102030 [Trametes maxima]|nr:hypothetical protein C8Q78DRAFT_102030 [Trametes maxima]
MHFHAHPVLYSFHPALGTVTWVLGLDVPPNIRTLEVPLVAFLAAACVPAIFSRSSWRLVARLAGWVLRALELTLHLVLAFWYLAVLFWICLGTLTRGVSVVLSGVVSVVCKATRILRSVLDLGLSLLRLAGSSTSCVYCYLIKRGAILVSCPRVLRTSLGSSSYVESGPTILEPEDTSSAENDTFVDIVSGLPEENTLPIAACSSSLALAPTPLKVTSSLAIADPALSPPKTTVGLETLGSPCRSDLEPPRSTAQARDLVWVERECEPIDAVIPLDEAKEVEIRRLGYKIRNLQAEKNRCQRECDEAWAQRDQLQIKYDDFFKANDHALFEKDAQIARLIAQLKASERTSQQCHSTAVHAQEIADANLARAEESEEALAAATEDLPALRDENIRLRSQIIQLGQENANLGTSAACAEARAQGATRENTDLRKDIHEADEKHAEARNKIERLEGLIASIHREMKQKDDIIAARNGKLAKKKRVVAAYKQVLEAKGRTYEHRVEEEKQRHEREVKAMRQKLLGSSARDRLTSAMEMKKLRDELKAMDVACREYLTKLDIECMAQLHRKEEEIESLRAAFEKEVAQLKADHQLHIAQLRAGPLITGSPSVQRDTPIDASPSFYLSVRNTSTGSVHGQASFVDVGHDSGSFWIGEDDATGNAQSSSGEPSIHPPSILPPSSSENEFSILQCVPSLRVSPSQAGIGSGENHIDTPLTRVCSLANPTPSTLPQGNRASSPITRMASTSCDLLRGQNSFDALSPDTSSCWMLPPGAPPFGIIRRDETPFESDRLSISSLSPQPSFNSEEASLASFEIPREAGSLPQLLDEESFPFLDMGSSFSDESASLELVREAGTSDCFEKSEFVIREPLGRLMNAGSTPARPRRPAARA